MFAYCGNNPVNQKDSTGHFWSEIWEFAKTAISEIGRAISNLAPAYEGCRNAAVADGPLPFGDTLGAIAAVSLTAGAVGYGIYQASKATAEKSEAKGKAVAIPQAKKKQPTVIYRYGGTNPGNLTPKEKDRGTGLSFSTIPMKGAAKTTIEELNATGIVYAIQDKPTHVSVYPIGGTMDDWINIGSSSIWTQAVKSVVVKWDGVE